VSATGTQPLSYQWKKNSLDIAGATDPSYTTPPATAEDNLASFLAVVTNIAGSATSAPMILHVNLPPTIVVQPEDQSVRAGKSARFRVIASGKGPLSYQWTKNGSEIPGANTPSYSTPPTIPADNGALFAVHVSNVLGEAVSRDAVLTVR